MRVSDRAKSVNYMYARSPRHTAQKRQKLEFQFQGVPELR